MAAAFLFSSGVPAQEKVTRLEGRLIEIRFNERMHTQVIARIDGRETALGGFQSSEYLSLASGGVKDFVVCGAHSETVRDRIGAGVRHTLTGEAASLRKTVRVTFYESFPTMAVFEVSYANSGQSEVMVTG